ncbi:MAG: hypothetical protein ACOCP8_05930, partial [archaeon]
MSNLDNIISIMGAKNPYYVKKAYEKKGKDLGTILSANSIALQFSLKNDNFFQFIGDKVYLKDEVIKEIDEKIEEAKISDTQDYQVPVLGEKISEDNEIIREVPRGTKFSYFEKNILEKFPADTFTTDMSEPSEYYDLNSDNLQVLKANIVSFYKAISYPITLAYKCTDMNCKTANDNQYFINYHSHSQMKWETSVKCHNIIGYTKDGSPKYCNKAANIDYSNSTYRTMYFYSMRVRIKKKNLTEPSFEEVKVFSTKQLKRFGQQVVAGFKMINKSPTEHLFMLIDTEEVESSNFDLQYNFQTGEHNAFQLIRS